VFVASQPAVVGAVTLAVYPWDITLSRVRPDDSAMNVIAGTITTITELGNRARVTLGPISADITIESLRRLGLAIGDSAYASFKATGTRIVANGPTPDQPSATQDRTGDT